MNHNSLIPHKDKPSIFLSSAGADRELVARVAAGLRSEGADIWWDQNGIGWGDNWVETLNHELNRCSAYLILIGNRGIHRWVKAELWLAFKHHFEYGLPILPVLLADVVSQNIPPFLSSIQTEHLPSKPTANDFAALVSVLQHSGLRGEGTACAADLGAGVCPFPGLEAFQHDEQSAQFFFGRQVETLEMLRLLGYGLDGVLRHWLQVEGASGVGKSSLVCAGLIPAVKRGWLGETPDAANAQWITIVMRPGSQPVETLAMELEHALVGWESPPFPIDRTGSLPGPPGYGDVRTLLSLLKRNLPAQTRIVLVVDQFEELFTLTEDDHVRQQFDTLLAEALLDPDIPLFLITAIRGDYMHRFAKLPRLETLLNEQARRYYLRPIKQWGLRDALLSPAKVAGLRWSERTLPERIIDDAFPARHGALSLVANVLRLLWEQSRARRDKVLRAEDYLKLGGIGGALANTADQLLDDLGRDGQKRAKRLLLALVRPGGNEDSKRSISLTVALKEAGGGPQARRVLEQLSGVHAPNAPGVFPRLILVLRQAKAGETQYTVELVHEILLRTDPRSTPYWKTLKDWVDAYRRQLENREIIQARAKKWAQQGKPWFGKLPSGGELREFKRAGALTSTADQYLQASSRKNRLIKSISIVLFLGTLLLADRFWLEAQGLGWYDRYTRTLANIGIILEPEMLFIPGGSFMMGSPDALGPDADPDAQSNELPQHKRVFTKPFLIGKYEVTFAQYDVFARATNRKLPDDQGWGRGQRPVINVNWQDAVAYTKWLSQQTKKENYRLPTEAEWEYAARAETKTRYWWGDELGKNRANCSGCGSEWDSIQSAPVGSFDPNVFGLYDTAGNVWEWVQDCWHDSYHAAPEDGNIAWMQQDGGFCDPRVVRGGSWFSLPQYARSAARGGNWQLSKIHIRGFRLALDL